MQSLKEISYAGEAFVLRKESFFAGAVIAVCELVACWQINDSLMMAGSREEFAFGTLLLGDGPASCGISFASSRCRREGAKCFGIGRGR